ncbi:outer membrane protein transport protein [Ignavibacteria bacterium 4148-Me]|uniref:OmpP1/FadL family transporter n=1 Tax=Rosettibacter primus TaxID=3111523 RepID=UPI00336BE8BF
MNSYIRIFLLLFLSSNIIHAGGTNRLIQFGTKSTSLNSLYYAGNDGISNVYLNPAGLGLNVSKSFIEFSIFTKTEEQIFDSQYQGLFKSLLDDDINFGAGLFYSISENIKTAIAIESVVDYKVSWPYVLLFKIGKTSVTTASDMYNEITTKRISPSISYKTNKFMLGLSLDVFQVVHNVAYAIGNDKYLKNIGLPTYQLDMSNKGWGLEYIFGVIYELSNKTRIGLSINSGTSIKLKGTANSKLYEIRDSTKSSVGVESEFQNPWRIGFGILYKINNYINLNFDFRYNIYSSLNEKIVFTYDNKKWESNKFNLDTITGFSAGYILQKFKDSFDAGAGIEYKASHNLEIYLGYRYSSTPNKEETYNLLMPTVNQHSISCGLSYHDSEMTISGSIIYNMGDSKKVLNKTNKLFNGLYDIKGVIPMLTIKYIL